MKYTGLRNQIAALRAQLPRAGQTIVIVGGVADGTAAAAPEPQQLELPLPKPPPSHSGAQRHVFAKPAAQASQRPPLGDPEPGQPEGWEARWFRDQRARRRDQGR